ncbi:MAG: hypothetical protein ACKVJU_02030 [Verrucomicrobiales bacterium]
MKIPFFFIAVLTVVAAFGFSASVQANPPAKQQVIAQAPQAVNGAAAKSNPGRVPTNMGNYWDAKQWDREGGDAFWHATTESRTKSTTKNAKKRQKRRSPC